MQYRVLNAGFGRATLLALILLGVAACSTSSNVDVMLFADPGKYEYHTCEQILKAGDAVADARERLRHADPEGRAERRRQPWSARSPIAANIAPWSRSSR